MACPPDWEKHLLWRWIALPLAYVAWLSLTVVTAAQAFHGSAAAFAAVAMGAVLPMILLACRHAAVSQGLRRRNRDLRQDISQLRMAEQLAGVGRWSIDIASGQHRWSTEVCAIVGVPPDTPPTPGVLADILVDGLSQMEATFLSHLEDREPFIVEFEVENPIIGTRILRARACNAHSPEGVREHVFMVVQDVSEEYTRVAMAERDREEALAREREAQELANTDPLTGLPNRRAAMMALDRAIIGARADGSELGLIVFDIDHFKHVNDRHGHPAGDRVLAEVGRIAMRNCRDGQLAARVGGEEFLMLIANANEPAVAGAAERLRLAIEAGTAMAPVPNVTISLGRAMLRPGDTSLTLFVRADDALYAAKRSGRNRVALAA